MKTFKVLSLLLSYPEARWLDHLDELEATLQFEIGAHGGAEPLRSLLDMLRNEALISVQENYVDTFDRNPSHSLHLFEHVHGESRERGAAMVNLLEEYRQRGFDASTDELPDYVPLFLEFLSLLPEPEALALLGEAIHVLAHIGDKLAKNGNAYSVIFDTLAALSPAPPRAIEAAAVRAMEETLETFGPSPDGTEPLLTPQNEIVRVAVPRPAQRLAQRADEIFK